MAKQKPPQANKLKSTAPAPKPQQRPSESAQPMPDWKGLADAYALPVLAIILALAAILRILNLDALSLWVDEFVHVNRASDVANGTGPLLTTDNNGILLTLVIIPFFKIFGSDSAWLARFPSVLFGIGTVWLLYRIAADLFGRYAGLIAAFLGSTALYLVFWSKIARNYAIFAFFFLFLCWQLWLFFEKNEAAQAEESTSGKAWQFSAKHLGLAALGLVAALLSHQLTIFFFFSLTAYTTWMAASKFLNNSPDALKNRYFRVACIAFPLSLLMLLPGLNGLLRLPLSALLSQQQIDWVLPQWSRLGELLRQQPWEAFEVYNGVLRYSPTVLYFTGLAGIFAAFRLHRKAGVWLFSTLVVPFLLMSFIFREPALPRYFIFVFPWFLIANAAFFVWLWRWMHGGLLQNASNGLRYACVALPFVFALCSVRWGEMKRLVLAEQLEGHVVNRNVSSFNFTNWREPAQYVLKNKQPGDVMMSTVTTAASYYLGGEKVLWFRQNTYDTQRKQYSPMPSVPGNSAATLEDLQRTVQNNQRGWLLADYYMDNVLVDDRARMFVFQNMTFYPEASQDGSVMLFGWDNSKPKPQQQNMVLQLGRAADKIISRDNEMVFPPEIAQNGAAIDMIVRTNGIDTDKEALVIFNGQQATYLPVNKPGGGIETHRVPLQAGSLRPGRNVIQVAYDEEMVKKDPNKGFTMYYLSFAPR
jgi:4-amino-4-deoxy-L-arabinose transferase-like glycosyltransferase